MATKITRYKPDTCECILEYSWDDTTTEDQRVHTPTSIVQKCAAHQTIPDTPTVFNTVVMDENPRKNLSLDEILQNAPSTAWYDIDATSGTRVFKKGITIDWTWSGTAPNRSLALTITGITLTTQQRNTLQTRLNNKFGINKVTIT
jgi:hypothetical protein